MGDKSAIEWTDATWNPVTGCTKVSQGCKNCYAERLAPKVFAGQKIRTHYYELPGTPLDRPRVFTDVITHPDRLDQPLRWKKPRRIFVNSMSDLFHDDIPGEFIFQVFQVMAQARQHTFQVLTKRPERMQQLISSIYEQDEEPPLQNIWFGVSVEDQATADERISLLQQTPAAVRFLSCEPLLGRMNIARYLVRKNIGGPGEKTTYGIDWVIAGGESGPKARPSHPDWFRSLRDQCAAADVPFFFKQHGEWLMGEQRDDRKFVYQDGHVDDPGASDGMDIVYSHASSSKEFESIWRGYWCDGAGNILRRLGKKAAGRLLDGRTHDEFPARP